LFAVLTTFVGGDDEVAAATDAHVAFLQGLCRDGRVLLAGPSPQGGGGVILATGDDPEEVRRLFAEDPFLTERVAEYRYVAFTAKLAGPVLASFIGQAPAVSHDQAATA
jgi:uncharacterized protein YciI